MPYLPYEEPGISTILSLASFLLLLNISRYILDHLLYCGIIGEILIGIIWGLPVGGTSWLTQGAQETVQALGYLGLIGLVFEGGLDTSLTLLRQNAHTSVAVATIGLLVPIALSFLLLVLPFSSSGVKTYPTPLAAFSAGASLCSTSLGTTFAILSSANMQRTRVGVVLVGAALMDDVVGLVMVNIVTTLGNGENGGWPIARPIVASFGLLLLTLAICQYALKPVWRWLLSVMGEGAQLDPPINPIHNRHNMATKLLRKIPHLSFILPAILLISFVTIAAFIKASVLFAAFIAGGVVSFLWSQGSRQQQSGATLQDGQSKMYEEYFKPAMDHILVPFFFASIGFAIPITEMFTGLIVWKGIVYALLMMFGKGMVSTVIYFEFFMKKWTTKPPAIRWWKQKKSFEPNSIQMRANPPPPTNLASELSDSAELASPPYSMALLVAFAMVARGEIGFLIASLSQSSGTLTLRRKESSENISSGEEIFLVIIWAVVICTIIGPLGLGIIVRRMRA